MSEADSVRDRKRRYEALLEVVEYNTAGPGTNLPAAVRESYIKKNRYEAGLGPREVDTVLRAAVENGDLIMYRGREGHPRFARRTIGGLRAVIGAENDREHPSVELIEACRDEIDSLQSAREVRGGGR